jgi:hypothetical protein
MGIKIRHTRALIGFLPIGFRISGTHCHPYTTSTAVCCSTCCWASSSFCASSVVLWVLLLPLLVLIPPPTIFVQQPAIKSKQISTYKKDVFRNRCKIKNIGLHRLKIIFIYIGTIGILVIPVGPEPTGISPKPMRITNSCRYMVNSRRFWTDGN